MITRESKFKVDVPSREEVFNQIKDERQPKGCLTFKVAVLSNKECWDEELGWCPLFDGYEYNVVDNYPVL